MRLQQAKDMAVCMMGRSISGRIIWTYVTRMWTDCRLFIVHVLICGFEAHTDGVMLVLIGHFPNRFISNFACTSYKLICMKIKKYIVRKRKKNLVINTA
jgi:hypothetical protein